MLYQPKRSSAACASSVCVAVGAGSATLRRQSCLHCLHCLHCLYVLHCRALRLNSCGVHQRVWRRHGACGNSVVDSSIRVGRYHQCTYPCVPRSPDGAHLTTDAAEMCGGLNTGAQWKVWQRWQHKRKISKGRTLSVVVCKSAELAPGTMRLVAAPDGRRKVLVLRTAAGSLHCVGAKCPYVVARCCVASRRTRGCDSSMTYFCWV